MIGETQWIERILESFTVKYVKDNNELCEQSRKNYLIENFYILGYSYIMLNTDLHNPIIKIKMRFEVFRKNLRQILVQDFISDLNLQKIYTSIQMNEIKNFNSQRFKTNPDIYTEEDWRYYIGFKTKI